MKRKNTIIKQQPAEENIDLPGNYDASEDITVRATRAPGDFDGEVRTSPTDVVYEDENIDEADDETETATSEYEVTKDDLEALGPKDLSLDMGEDEKLLKHRVYPVDFSGKDIDIPGSELDDAQEAIGEEDEENNSYSLGGDRD